MTSLAVHVQLLRDAQDARSEAEKRRLAVAKTLSPLLQARWELFCELFEPLVKRADRLDGLVSMAGHVRHEGFGEWGNSGVVDIRDEEGFLIVTSVSSFGCEVGYREAWIPLPFVGEDGEDRMRSAAEQVSERLAAAEEAERARQAEAAVLAERADLRRLQLKYPEAVAPFP